MFPEIDTDGILHCTEFLVIIRISKKIMYKKNFLRDKTEIVYKSKKYNLLYLSSERVFGVTQPK